MAGYFVGKNTSSGEYLKRLESIGPKFKMVTNRQTLIFIKHLLT